MNPNVKIEKQGRLKGKAMAQRFQERNLAIGTTAAHLLAAHDVRAFSPQLIGPNNSNNKAAIIYFQMRKSLDNNKVQIKRLIPRNSLKKKPVFPLSI